MASTPLPLYAARTPLTWYVKDNAEFEAAWAGFWFDGLDEIGLDVEFTHTYDDKGKRQRTAALVQMTSRQGTLLYHSWLTNSESSSVSARMTDMSPLAKTSVRCPMHCPSPWCSYSETGE